MNISKFFNKKELRKNKFTQLAFEHGGHKYYTFGHAGEISSLRLQAYIVATNEVQLGVNYSDLISLINITEKHINAGNMSGVAGCIHTLKSYVDLYPATKTLFKVADCVVLIDDEDEPDQRYSQLKAEQFEKHIEVQSFFLMFAIESMNRLMKFSNPIDVEDYLQEKIRKLTDNQFSNLIGKNTFSEFLTN